MTERFLRLIGQVRSYLHARFGPKASALVQATRVEACNACPERVTYKKRDYCGQCGCPMSALWPDARLDRKTAMQNATCPLKKWI